VNGLAVRAQWYPPQEWFAEAETESMTAAKAASPTSEMSFFNIRDPLVVESGQQDGWRPLTLSAPTLRA
jgi:hypothetical protein